MKILFISHKYPPSTGGMEKFSFELIRHFEQSNHKVFKIVYDGTSNKFLWYLTLKNRVKIFLKYHKDIDVIHLNDGLMAAMCIWLKDVFKGKVIVTIHGLDIVFPLPYFQKKIIPKFNNFDKIICVSNATKLECEAKGIVNSKLTTILNGIDHKISSPIDKKSGEIIKDRLGIEVNKKILVGLGRPVKRKGYSWFVNEVLPYIDEDIVFVLCGPKGKYNEKLWNKIIPSKLRKYIELLFGIGTDEVYLRALEKKYPKRFIRPGYLPTSDINRLMQDAEIFIMPNIKVDNDMEGFGLVALEACMNNCIVLASNIDGITDAIINNSNGFLIKCQDKVEWVNKINEVLTIKDKSTLIKNFKEFTLANYSWTKMCNEYEKEFLS